MVLLYVQVFNLGTSKNFANLLKNKKLYNKKWNIRNGIPFFLYVITVLVKFKNYNIPLNGLKIEGLLIFL